MSSWRLSIVGLVLLASTSFQHEALAAPLERPAPPPVKPVAETHFGTTVTDNYRYMEKEDASVVDWMKAEGRFARAFLDALPGHADLLSRMSASPRHD